jgi:hypothetical protein
MAKPSRNLEEQSILRLNLEPSTRSTDRRVHFTWDHVIPRGDYAVHFRRPRDPDLFQIERM